MSDEETDDVSVFLARLYRLVAHHRQQTHHHHQHHHKSDDDDDGTKQQRCVDEARHDHHKVTLV